MKVATLDDSIKRSVPSVKKTKDWFEGYRWRWIVPALLTLFSWLGVTHYLIGDGSHEPLSEPYAEDTPLTWILGGGPEVSVVAAILSERHRTVSCVDVAHLAGVEEQKACDHLDELSNHGLVDVADEERSYRVNMEHDVVRKLVEIEDALLDQWYADFEARNRSLS